jgi:membrane-bound lytic murein transglycosylase D
MTHRFTKHNCTMLRHLLTLAAAGTLLWAAQPANAQQTQAANRAETDREYAKAKRLADSLLIRKNFDLGLALFSDVFRFVAPIDQAKGFSQEIAIAEAPDLISKDQVFSPKPDVIHFEDEDVDYSYIPQVSDDVIEQRLAGINQAIPLAFNEKVRGFIDYFSLKRRDYTRRMLSKKNIYFPLFERYLKEYGLPDELKYLSIVESALNPRARSRAGAVGLWQFMPGTGAMFGLRQNVYVDERMDPEKATIAACKYLSQLHKLFGQNWELALAAYNSGPGTVNRAIRLSGGVQDFWTIYKYLPQETRSYVPMFTAVTYSMHYAEEHNIVESEPYFPIPHVSVGIQQSVSIKTLAQKLNVCVDDLEELNPELRQGVVPPSQNEYALRIPADRAEFFYNNKTEILASARSLHRETPPRRGTRKYWRWLQQQQLAAEGTSTDQNEEASRSLAENKSNKKAATVVKTTTHVVQSGESVGLIAQKYGVTIAQLKSWNRGNIKGNTIYAGKTLKIQKTVKAKGEPDQEQLANTTQAESTAKAAPATLAKGKNAKLSDEAAAGQAKNKKAMEQYHTVRRGDTLWGVARRYGMSMDDLRRLNGLSKTAGVKIGQKLKVG